jgi:HD superfamily phosphohydrolase
LVLPESDGELMISEDGIHAVEQFVLAKYYMTANVYRHRVRIITDQMITRAIRLGIDVDKLELLTQLYQFDGSADFIRNYQQWDDARFMETFCPVSGTPPGVKSGAMLKLLRERKLLKEVFKDKIDKPYDARSRETLRGLHKREADALSKAVSRRVAEYLTKDPELKLETEIDSDFVIAHSYSIKSARESSRNNEGDILVNVKLAPQPFTDESTLFKSINERYSDNFVVVFAPIEWPEPDKKDELRAKWKEPIRGMIQEEWKRLKQ